MRRTRPYDGKVLLLDRGYYTDIRILASMQPKTTRAPADLLDLARTKLLVLMTNPTILRHLREDHAANLEVQTHTERVAADKNVEARVGVVEQRGLLSSYFRR